MCGITFSQTKLYLRSFTGVIVLNIRSEMLQSIVITSQITKSPPPQQITLYYNLLNDTNLGGQQ